MVRNIFSVYVRLMAQALLMLLVVGALAQANNVQVEVKPEIRYQTISGWGKVTPWLPAHPLLRDQCIEMGVNELGLNRLRFEGVQGNKLTERRWEWLNDDNDPHTINWDGFNTEQLDAKVTEWLVPWKKAVEARGETFDLYYSPSFYYNGSSGDLSPWMVNDPNEYAEWATAVLLRLRDKHGIEPNYISICNEAGHQNAFTPQFTLTMMKALMPRLRQQGFKTMVQYPESLNANVAMQYLDAARNDPEVWKWIGLVSYHWYGADNQTAMVKLRDFARERNLPTAQTEFMNLSMDHLYDDMVLGGVSYWEIYGKASPDYSAALSHISSTTYNYGPWYWSFRQVSHFVRPGAVRIECTSTDPQLRCLAFERQQRQVVVLISTRRPFTPRATTVTGLRPGTYGVSQTVGSSGVTDELGLRTVGPDGTLTVTVKGDSTLTIYGRDAVNRPPTFTEWRSQPDFLKLPVTTLSLRCAATDPERDPLTYTWSVVSKPQGATVTLAQPTAATTRADGLTLPGSYFFRVAVHDGRNTVTRDVAVGVFEGNQPPVPVDVHNRNPVWVRVKNGGTLLRGNAWDIERDQLTFKWTVVRQPAGAATRLETPDKSECKVMGMTLPGDYVFRMEISDPANTVSHEHTVPVYP
ncbi:MAG: hypothetical protein BWY76_01098 [bacterium ADurb.Bin429]|nr:MAG: hypothetical protein BWY76_01098 [bacterium ADurb.Bin429]